MTPDEFASEVLPAALTAWKSRCFCSSPGFRKLLSFNFQDYGTAPMALADSEIMIHQIVRLHFARVGEWRDTHDGDLVQAYTCSQCGARCEETYDEYSISMYRSFIRYSGEPAPAAVGLYLIGMRAFSREDYLKVHDFQQAKSKGEFLHAIGSV